MLSRSNLARYSLEYEHQEYKHRFIQLFGRKLRKRTLFAVSLAMLAFIGIIGIAVYYFSANQANALQSDYEANYDGTRKLEMDDDGRKQGLKILGQKHDKAYDIYQPILQAEDDYEYKQMIQELTQSPINGRAELKEQVANVERVIIATLKEATTNLMGARCSDEQTYGEFINALTIMQDDWAFMHHYAVRKKKKGHRGHLNTVHGLFDKLVTKIHDSHQTLEGERSDAFNKLYNLYEQKGRLITDTKQLKDEAMADEDQEETRRLMEKIRTNLKDLEKQKSKQEELEEVNRKKNPLFEGMAKIKRRQEDKKPFDIENLEKDDTVTKLQKWYENTKEERKLFDFYKEKRETIIETEDLKNAIDRELADKGEVQSLMDDMQTNLKYLEEQKSRQKELEEVNEKKHPKLLFKKTKNAMDIEDLKRRQEDLWKYFRAKETTVGAIKRIVTDTVASYLAPDVHYEE